MDRPQSAYPSSTNGHLVHFHLLANETVLYEHGLVRDPSSHSSVMYLGMELLGHTIILCFPFKKHQSVFHSSCTILISS
jgi:hypothetical protein